MHAHRRRFRRHVHGRGRLRPGTRPPGVPQGRLDAGRPGGGHRQWRAGGRRARRGAATRRGDAHPRHDGRHQPGAAARRCAGRADHHRRVPGRAAHPAPVPAAHVRPARPAHGAAGTARAALRGARAHALRRHRADSTGPRVPCRRDRRHPRRRCAGGGRRAAAQLRQSPPRAGDRRGGGAPAAGCRRQPVARADGRARRVRALQHLRDERLRAARHRALRHPAGRRAA